jgi:hypothetical protein
MITEAQLTQFEALRTATLEAVRAVGFKGDLLIQVELEYMELALKLIERANKPTPATPAIVPDLAPAKPIVVAPAPVPASVPQAF